jgi:DNA uptake protein ComE-like DNA-binding protein
VGQAAPAETVERAAVVEAADLQLLDINTASPDELDRLAGRIGKAIVRGRPYQSIDDLVSKRVLNRGTFGQIKDRITVR